MSRRRLVTHANLATALAAALLIAGVVNWLALRHFRQWDWTAGGLFSLTARSVSVAASLPQKVRIVSFLTESADVGPDAIEQIHKLIDGYRSHAPDKVTFETIDPLRDPLRARTLLSEFGLDPSRDAVDVVAVQCGARRKQLRVADLVEFDAPPAGGGAPPVKRLKAEDALTSALLAVTRAKRPVVRFATGHGERDFSAPGETGLSRLADALKRTDVDLQPWDALGASAVPEGTDAVIVAAPASPWLAAERDALARYLEHGGRAVVLLEPQLQRGAAALTPSGLEPLLAAWGIGVEQDIAIDPTRALPFFGAETLYADSVPGHPVTDSLGGQPVLFELAQSLTLAKPPPTGVTLVPLCRTSNAAWGETGFARLAEEVKQDVGDVKGPLTLAVAAERTAGGKGPGGRMIVAGDVDVVANLAIDQLANRGLALNGFAWLLAEERSLGIPAKDRTISRLFLSADQVTALFLFTTLALPAAAVAVGLAVWWRRRRN